jgi:hypothetical protein
MNTKFFTSALIAIASLTSVSVFAAGADNPPEKQTTFVSMQTRAEVRAAAIQAQKGPVTASSQVDGGMTASATPLTSERSRSDVRAHASQDSSTFNPAPGRA